jgi:hypothetical protein
MSDATQQLHNILASKQAPAQIGKPIWAKDFEEVKVLLTKKEGQFDAGLLFGKRLADNDTVTNSTPLNFGSRRSMSFSEKKNADGILTDVISDQARIRLLAWKKALSNVQIQAQIKSAQDGYYTPFPNLKLMQSVKSWKTFEAMSKAFDIASFGQWIDEVQSRFFFEEYEIPYMLADEFDSMPMSSPLVRVPGALGLLEGELEADTGVFSEQSNSEASYVVESKNNVVHTKITQDLLDDSAPAIIEKQRKEVVMGIVRSYERAMLDGDSSGTHIDDDTQAGSAKLFSKAFNGLRKRAFDNEAVVGSSAIVFDHNDTPSKDLFANLLKKMKCQGADKKDLVYIVGCTTGHDIVTGAIPELFTAFALGSIASNATGIIPPIFGVKVVESQLVREDLGLDGKADNPAVGDTTYAMCVQKSRFMNFVRQATRVWAAPSLPSSDNMLMSGKARHAFDGVPQSAQERSVVMAINVKTV